MPGKEKKQRDNSEDDRVRDTPESASLWIRSPETDGSPEGHSKGRIRRDEKEINMRMYIEAKSLGDSCTYEDARLKFIWKELRTTLCVREKGSITCVREEGSRVHTGGRVHGITSKYVRREDRDKSTR